METPSGPRPGKLSSSGLPRGRPPKHSHPQETAARTATAASPSENHKHGEVCEDRAEGRKKGRPRVDLQELRSIPAHLMVQWKEEFKQRSRVKCPCSGCWLEFPSIYGLKYHYQRCQGAPMAEKLSHACRHCEAVFATKVRLQKHVLWNHPDQLQAPPQQLQSQAREQVQAQAREQLQSQAREQLQAQAREQLQSQAREQLQSQAREQLQAQARLHKSHTKSLNSGAKKRPTENSPPSPASFKVKKTHQTSSPSHNGELTPSRSERKAHTHQTHPPQQTHQTHQTYQPPQTLQLHQTNQTPQTHLPPEPQVPQRARSHQSTSSDAGGSESEGGSLPPPFHDEDPERTRHRRKQKTPKKFTGEQPSISGTFGLKGMTKAEEKLKAGRGKRPEGGGAHGEEPQRRASTTGSRRDPRPVTSGPPVDTQWQHAISERGQVVCPTCGIVTRKTVAGLKKHMEICQKLQDALKCQQCQKQFRSKAGLNYHAMAEHSSTPSGSEGQPGNEQEERERLRRVLKQMGRIKCPSEGCSAHFSSLMGFQYHQKRCGREVTEEEKPVLLCPHCGRSYRSKAGRDYHLRTEHPATNNGHSHSTTNNGHSHSTTNNGHSHSTTNNGHSHSTTNNGHSTTTNNSTNTNNGHSTTNNNTAITTTNNNNNTTNNIVNTNTNSSSSTTDGSRITDKTSSAEEAPSGTKGERSDRQERPQVPRPREVQRDTEEQEGEPEDFERTPSGRVRRRSAQVAVFHLQEIAEDELAKDWGTKRRITDDLVPDSKRLNYTRPGLPNFSPKLLETWKNEVKEKGFICCTNGGCEAVYSSVSGLKAHLANCNQEGNDLGKYTCLICQKEFSSESGVKYHISKSHAQNWFRAAPHASPSNKSRAPASAPAPVNGLQPPEVRNGAATGKKRGRKPKERPPEATPLPAKTPAPAAAPDDSPPTPRATPAATPPTKATPRAPPTHGATPTSRATPTTTPAQTALSSHRGVPGLRQPSPLGTRRGKAWRGSPVE